jgi:hypothetical protein
MLFAMKTLLPVIVAALLAALGHAQENPPSGEAGGEHSGPSAGWLGITLESDGTSVRVASVTPGSPAEKSGVETGAIIAGIDGITVGGDSDAVTRAIRAKKPGEEVELQWRIENSLKAMRIKLSSKLAASIQADAAKLQKHSGTSEGKSPAPEDGNLRTDRIREGFKFTPVPESRPFDPAERQLRKIAPEVELDPFEKVDKENSKSWKPVPPFEAVPAFPDAPRPDDIRRLKERFETPAPKVELDPFKLEEKLESLRDRRDLDLKLEPVGEPKIDDLSAEKLRLTSPLELESRRQTLFNDKTAWESVEKRVAGVLEKSDLEPEVRRRVMEALERARISDKEDQLAGEEAEMLKKARQIRLEAEISKLESQMREHIEQARKLRRELEELRK